MLLTDYKDILQSLSTGIKNILYRIIEEREFDIPNNFVKYIDFVTLTKIIEDESCTNDKIIKIINRVYKTMENDTQENFLITLIIIHNRYEFLSIFDQDEIAILIKSKSCDIDTATKIIHWYIDNCIVVSPIVLYAYMEKRLKKVKKPILRKKREKYKYDYMIDIFINEMKLEKYQLAYVLPSLCEILPSDITRRYSTTNRCNIYQYSSTYIVNDATLSDLEEYLDIYQSANRNHIIPIEILSVLMKYDTYNLSSADNDFVKIHYIKRSIRECVHKNANNANLIYWVPISESKKILKDVSLSEIPISDIELFCKNFNIRKPIDDNIMFNLLSSGVTVSSLIPYMSDVKKFISEIFSFRLFNKYVFVDNHSDRMNIESEPNEYLLDILHINCKIDIGKDTPINFLDYVIQHNIISDIIIYYTIEKAIFKTRDIFMSLNTDSVSILLAGKDKHIYTVHPEIITEPVYTSLTQSEINDIILKNPKALQYIPFKYIDKDILYLSLRNHGMTYVPLMTSETNPLPSEFVLSLIMKYDIGYGYIADLPTVTQRNAVIDAIVNRSLSEEFESL